VKAAGGGGGGAGIVDSGSEWLHAALAAAKRKPTTWLRNASGASVLLTDASDADTWRGEAPLAEKCLLLGEVEGSGGKEWRVQTFESSEARTVPAAALRRLPPRQGDLAICVLGDSARLGGEVLSADSAGLAVLRLATPQGARVRVMPLDALCRLDGQMPTEAAPPVLLS
jgi:hypothetical protein